VGLSLEFMSWVASAVSALIIVGLFGDHSSPPEMPTDLSGIVSLVVTSTIVAPIVEEIVFRGFVLRALRERFGRRGGIVLSALIFAVLHFQPWYTVSLFFGGAALAIVAEWSDSIWPSVWMHATWNSALVLLLYSGA